MCFDGHVKIVNLPRKSHMINTPHLFRLAVSYCKYELHKKQRLFSKHWYLSDVWGFVHSVGSLLLILWSGSIPTTADKHLQRSPGQQRSVWVSSCWHQQVLCVLWHDHWPGRMVSFPKTTRWVGRLLSKLFPVHERLWRRQQWALAGPGVASSAVDQVHGEVAGRHGRLGGEQSLCHLFGVQCWWRCKRLSFVSVRICWHRRRLTGFTQWHEVQHVRQGSRYEPGQLCGWPLRCMVV